MSFHSAMESLWFYKYIEIFQTRFCTSQETASVVPKRNASLDPQIVWSIRSFPSFPRHVSCFAPHSREVGYGNVSKGKLCRVSTCTCHPYDRAQHAQPNTCHTPYMSDMSDPSAHISYFSFSGPWHVVPYHKTMSSQYVIPINTIPHLQVPRLRHSIRLVPSPSIPYPCQVHGSQSDQCRDIAGSFRHG